MLGDRPRGRILIEASTDSEWVARCVEGVGHEVIVGDPNFAPMYATRTRKVKTDRRDARALRDACLLGAHRPAHRLSDPQGHGRGRLAFVFVNGWTVGAGHFNMIEVPDQVNAMIEGFLRHHV